MTDTLLIVDNLNISFITDEKVVHAVKNLSFTLKQGATLAIVGESGSGKSVTSLALLGLLPYGIGRIDSGKITFLGKDITHLSKLEYEQLRGNEIAMVFQEPMSSLNPLIKCGVQVSEAILKHNNFSKSEVKKRVLELFAEVKIPNPEESYYKFPHQMSGGQKQRVMIAMAISTDPKLLIADEPTTALDVTVQKEILELFSVIQEQRKMSILFISHDLNVVKNMADDILVMFQGDKMESGSVAQIFSNPQNEYTKALLKCKPDKVEKWRWLPTIKDILDGGFDEEVISEEQEISRNTLLQAEKPLFEIENVNLDYVATKNILGRPKTFFKALKNINLSIFKGETIGIVGESGCGKTSFGKVLVKLNKPTHGEVFYQGKNIFSDWDKSYAKEVQMIFQDAFGALNPRITIGSAIEEAMTVHKIGRESERKKAVQDLLQEVGLLAEHYERYPHEFSGGQRQRICIARGLAMQAKVFVCDESVSALDVSVQAQVLNLLQDLKEKFGLTLIFISHDISVIRHLSDRIAVMNLGSIVELEHSFEVIKNPKADYTKILLSAAK
jgi:peptide/nickel transport system ATP-binding protein